jgi:hypothetical protein
MSLDFGPDDRKLTVNLRSACLLYTSLVLSATVDRALGDELTAEDAVMMNQSFVAVAYAGHALVEAAKAKSN